MNVYKLVYTAYTEDREWSYDKHVVASDWQTAFSEAIKDNEATHLLEAIMVIERHVVIMD